MDACAKKLFLLSKKWRTEMIGWPCVKIMQCFIRLGTVSPQNPATVPFPQKFNEKNTSIFCASLIGGRRLRRLSAWHHLRVTNLPATHPLKDLVQQKQIRFLICVQPIQLRTSVVGQPSWTLDTYINERWHGQQVPENFIPTILKFRFREYLQIQNKDLSKMSPTGSVVDVLINTCNKNDDKFM